MKMVCEYAFENEKLRKECEELKKQNDELQYLVNTSRCGSCGTVINSDHLYRCHGDGCDKRVCEMCDEYCEDCEYNIDSNEEYITESDSSNEE